MTVSERLKEIENENHMSGGDRDISWLIARVKKLTLALEILSKEQHVSLYRSEMFEIAKKALDDET